LKKNKTNFVSDDDDKHKADDDHGITLHWEELSLFQRLILIKILRPDVLTASCNQFVKDSIGVKYLSAGSFDLKEIYEESSAKTPLIFILSPSEFKK
jgi:dynein heavy chain